MFFQAAEARFLLRHASIMLILALPFFPQAHRVIGTISVIRMVQNLNSSNVCEQPPSNVDLTQLSDSDLIQYGLPGKSQFRGREAFWADLLHHSKHRACASPSNGLSHNSFSRISNSNENNPNWAGYIGKWDNSNYYTHVEAQWYVPSLNLSKSPNPSLSSTWVGIGGDPSDGGGNLFQAGTDSIDCKNLSGYYCPNGTDYHAWLEYVFTNNTGPGELETFSVNPGDNVYAYVDYSSNQTVMHINDWVNGWYSNYYATYSDQGRTGEWVTERNSYGNTLYPLADFTSVAFVAAHTTDNGSSISVGSTDHNTLILTDPYGGHTLAYPGSISNDYFVNYWQASS